MRSSSVSCASAAGTTSADTADIMMSSSQYCPWIFFITVVNGIMKVSSWS